MAYLPKSKYKKRYTNGNELINLSTGRFYIGPYLELPNKKYYIGDTISNVGDELEPLIPSANNVVPTFDNVIYGALNPKYFNKEEKYKTPIATKIFPTEKDYLRGNMARYFGFRIQTGRYFEIDKKTHDDIQTGKVIDRSLYSSGKIVWVLKGDTEKINGTNIIKYEVNGFPGLRKLFNNLSEFGSL